MALEDVPVEYDIGDVALLRVGFDNEDGDLADPNVDVTIIIIDHDNAEVTNITELIGSLVQIENPSEGVYRFRHLVVSGDQTRKETWQYRFTCTSTGGEVAATGTIIAVAPGSYTDGQAFTLDDGVNDPVRFEFDDDASVTAGSIIIDLTAAVDDDALAVLIRAAINGAALLDITGTGADPQVDLTNDTVGSQGNVLMILEGTPPGTFLGMSGARPAKPTTAGERRFVVRSTDFPNP